MFKYIPGNHNFIISLNGEIRTARGYMPDLERNGNTVTIELYGKKETLDVMWLSHIAHFEIDLPDHFKSIIFQETNPRTFTTNSGVIGIFLGPLVVGKKYRVIPNYSQYAISEHGEVLHIGSSTIQESFMGSTDYPVVKIYDPDQSRFRHVFVHRLVAMAWCDNVDYVARPIVNHIDGNKRNFHRRNLEWCSYSENTMHAFSAGLMGRVSGKRYRVKDLHTGEIKEFNRISDLADVLGLSKKNRWKIKTHKTKATLIAGRYEVKDFDDESPWLNASDVVSKKNKHTVVITYPDGVVEQFHDNVSLMRKFKVWNISYNVREIVRVIKEKNPDYHINVVENHACRTIQALNITTKEVIESDTIRKMALLTSVAFSTIQKSVNSNDLYVQNGYIFRFKSDEPWPESFRRHPNAPMPILARNLETKEEIVFPSLKTVMKEFNITRFILFSRMKDQVPMGDWVFSEVI